MKNLILILLVVMPAVLWAQNMEETANELKPTAGEKTVELQLSPFGNFPININGLRLRSFSSSTQAFRLNVNIGISSNTDITQQENPDINLKELKSVNSSFTISISPGMEYHLKGTERLSPYYGWEGNIGYRQAHVKSENQNGDEVFYTKTTNAGNQGYFRLGAAVLAGLDFYIAKKLYLGTEFGFGANYTNYLSTRTTSNAPGFTEPDPVKRGSNFGIGLYANSQLRIGFVF